MKNIKYIILLIVVIIFSIGGTSYYYHNKLIQPIPSEAKALNLLIKITKNKAEVVKSFNAVGNLKGFVIKSKADPAALGIIYVDAAGRYIVSGTIIAANGMNISAQNFSTYIQPKSAVKAYKNIANTGWVEDGNANAPHKLYVVMDPNCIFCHRLYDALQPQIKAGNLAVRWIVTGIIKPSSKGKAYAILSAKNPAAALAQNEATFNEAKEEGGIKPITNPPANVVNQMNTNLKFVIDNRIVVTPVIYYQTKTGIKHVHAGLLTGKKLQTTIDAASNKF